MLSMCGILGTFSPPSRVSDLHWARAVRRVTWCMPGSLTSCFLWSWLWGNVPGIPGHEQPTILHLVRARGAGTWCGPISVCLDPLCWFRILISWVEPQAIIWLNEDRPMHCHKRMTVQIGGSVQERRNSSAVKWNYVFLELPIEMVVYFSMNIVKSMYVFFKKFSSCKLWTCGDLDHWFECSEVMCSLFHQNSQASVAWYNMKRHVFTLNK